MRAPPRRIVIAAQVIAAVLLFFFIGRELSRQWSAFRAQPLQADLRVSDILVSGAIVVATYALLVQTWRVLLAGSGVQLSFRRAARIWCISNLWRYIPGKVWQIGAMSALAQRENVSAASAAGTAILSTVLNIASGLALAMLLAWRWLDEWNPVARPAAIAVLIAAIVGLIALPYALPRIGAFAARVSGRDVQVQSPSTRAIVIATVGNVLSWLLYGLAFMWLVRGVLGIAAGATWQYIAVFTTSYIVGYLFLILPGGIGPREAVMLGLLTSLSLASPKQAALVTVASRVWLTFLELLPGLLFLAYDRTRRPSITPPPDV